VAISNVSSLDALLLDVFLLDVFLFANLGMSLQM